MIDGSQLPPLKAIIQTCNFFAKKSLGQHFLLDLNITHRIAQSVPNRTQGTIVEIGPGPGGLTRSLFACGVQRVVAIDKDPRAQCALAPLQALVSDRLQVYIGDALCWDWSQPMEDPVQVVANLPYNVATSILIHLLQHRIHFTGFTLMFQKEVADRLIAFPRTPEYGRLSILTQWCAQVDRLFDLPPSVFTPVPKVTSTVVRITPKPIDHSIAFEHLERVTHLFFQNRRKMLRHHLKHLDSEQMDTLQAAEIQDSMRPEELTVSQFCILAKVLHA